MEPKLYFSMSASDNHLIAFVKARGDDKSLERIMMEVIDSSSILYTSQATRLRVIVRNMALLHSLVRSSFEKAEKFDCTAVRVSYHTVGDILKLIATKRTKIIVKAGRIVISQSPTYLRSAQFSEETFGRMAIERSYLDKDISLKWEKLNETVKSLLLRLRILCTMQDCIEAMASPSVPSMNIETTDFMNAGNKEACTRLLECSTQINDLQLL